jgi:hypothetical protein
MSKLKTLYIFTIIFFFAASPILSAQIIKDDFRVNDDTTGGNNLAPDVEITESGETIIVWDDGRNGLSNIYGQVYDASGISVDTNFLVSPSLTSGSNPTISSYGDSLIVIWQEGSGQWLLSDGSGQGTSFSLLSGETYEPDVAVSDSGFFVVWHHSTSTGGQEIFLKMFDFNGDSIGPRMVVNDDGTSANQFSPRIGMDENGSFVVVWTDYRDGNYDIYGQRFDASGDTTGLGGNFLINDDGGSNSQNVPSCAMDSAGNFVVVWEDQRDGNYDIYGQRFDASGDTTGLGGNFLINDDGGSRNQRNPSCAMDKSGNFVVVWQDYRNVPSDIYGQRFDNNGISLGGNLRIDQSTGSEYEYDPRVSMNVSNFVVTWWNYRGSIYKRRFLNDGTPVSGQAKVNEFDATANQYNPAIDMNSVGNVVVTWQDHRNPDGIYFQRLNALGDTLGGNLRIDYGYNPDVAVAEDSSFVITYDYLNHIYYQRFNSSGGPIGSPAVISDTTDNSRYHSVIDLDSDKNAVVVWFDNRSGNSDIYAQMVESTGDTVGVNFRVNNDAGTTNQYYPAIAVAPSGRSLIVWEDRRNVDSDIYAQLYGSDGNPINSNFRIDSGGTDGQYEPDAGYLPDGNFIVVWKDFRIPRAIYGQIIDSLGAPVDTNFRISEEQADGPKVSVAPSGGFIVTWDDYRENNYNIFAQRYNPDCTPDSVNYKVNNEIEGLNPHQNDPDVATNGNNIIFVWEDPKWQRGHDVAAKVFSWEQGGIEEVGQEGKGVKILNISNPILSSKEWLSISLDSPAKVDFQIINVAGIVVSSKGFTYTTPGRKRVDFDVSKLPSGPYFLTFETDRGKAIKKTVVIR